MGLGARGAVDKVWDSLFVSHGSGFRVCGLRFGVEAYGLGFRV